MFFSSPEAPLLSEAGLYGLRASLNRPIVNVEDLPAGPARAAIALYVADYGEMALSVAVRSLEAGCIAIYRYQGDLSDVSDPAIAMEVALSFAEGMGFLFDDDIIAGDHGHAEALALWQDLLGESAGEAEDAAGPADWQAATDAGEIGEELLLEEIADAIPSVEPGAAEEPDGTLEFVTAPPTAFAGDGDTAEAVDPDGREGAALAVPVHAAQPEPAAFELESAAEDGFDLSASIEELQELRGLRGDDGEDDAAQPVPAQQMPAQQVPVALTLTKFRPVELRLMDAAATVPPATPVREVSLLTRVLASF